MPSARKAQGASSDAVAEQQRQEVESLRVEAAEAGWGIFPPPEACEGFCRMGLLQKVEICYYENITREHHYRRSLSTFPRVSLELPKSRRRCCPLTLLTILLRRRLAPTALVEPWPCARSSSLGARVVAPGGFCVPCWVAVSWPRARNLPCWVALCWPCARNLLSRMALLVREE